MGSPEGIQKMHDKMKQNLGEEGLLKELKRRSSKGGSVSSEAKKEAARLREMRKREAREGL